MASETTTGQNSFLSGSSPVVTSVTISDLDPDRPIRTNTSRTLVSGSILQAEVEGLSSNLGVQKLTGSHISTPGTNPAVGANCLYFKTDGLLYSLDSNGIETEVGSGSAGVSSGWAFSTMVTSPPSSMEVRFDNAIPNSVTSIFISATDSNGNNQGPILSTLAGGDSIYLVNGVGSNAKLYNILDSINNTTWYDLTVNLESESNVAAFLDAEVLTTQFFVTSNPFDQSLNTDDPVEFKEVTLPHQPTTSTPALDTIKLYANNDGTLHTIDENGLDVPIGDTRWKGTWSNLLTYEKGDMVIDQGWLSVALTTTTDPSSPQVVGEPQNVYQGPELLTLQQTTKSLLFGMRYSASKTGYVSGYRIETVVGNKYIIYIVVDPLGTPEIREIIQFTATTGGFQTFNLSTFLSAGSTFDLISIVAEPDPTPTTTTANYNYTKPTNVTAPLAGQISHAGKTLDTLSISKTDNDTTDRTALLASISSGDIIAVGGIRWSVQNSSDQGTYYNFAVAPAQQWTQSGVLSFDFEIVASVPVTYHGSSDVNYWVGDASISGILSLTGDYGTATINNRQYGIDLIYQPAVLSSDWDIMASSSSSVSAGAASINSGGNTGIIDGGFLSINGDTTKYDISSGHGIINSANIAYTEVYWQDMTATYTAGFDDNYVAINKDAMIVQQTVPFTNADYRDLIVIGQVVALIDQTNISQVVTKPNYINNVLAQLGAMSRSIGLWTDNGLVYSATPASLSLDRSAGGIWDFGSNYEQDVNNPNIKSFIVSSADEVFRFKRDGFVSNGTVLIDPNQYDNNGTLTAVANNNWTIQHVYMSINGNNVIYYGQDEYKDEATALASINDPFVIDNPSPNFIQRAYLVVQEGATTLASATFIEASKFGSTGTGASGGSATSLQIGYDNSTQPQITTSTALGALQIQRGSAADSDSVFDIVNGAGDTELSITGGGAINTFTSNLLLNNNGFSAIAIGNVGMSMGINASLIGDNGIALGLNSEADANVLALGSNVSALEGIQTVQPGRDDVCDLGDATHRFKDIVLSGKITLDSQDTFISDHQFTAYSGLGNVAIGSDTMNLATNATLNTCVGFACAPGYNACNRNVNIGAESGNVTTANDTVCVGYRSKCDNTTAFSIALGSDANSTLSNQCTIGGPTVNESIESIVPGRDNECDLGSATRQFKDIYLSGSIIGVKKSYVQRLSPSSVGTSYNVTAGVYYNGLISSGSSTIDIGTGWTYGTHDAGITIIVPSTGNYKLSCLITGTFNFIAGGDCRIIVNGATNSQWRASAANDASPTNNYMSFSCAGTLALTAADEIWVDITSAGAAGGIWTASSYSFALELL